MLCTVYQWNSHGIGRMEHLLVQVLNQVLENRYYFPKQKGSECAGIMHGSIFRDETYTSRFGVLHAGNNFNKMFCKSDT